MKRDLTSASLLMVILSLAACSPVSPVAPLSKSSPQTIATVNSPSEATPTDSSGDKKTEPAPTTPVTSVNPNIGRWIDELTEVNDDSWKIEPKGKIEVFKDQAKQEITIRSKLYFYAVEPTLKFDQTRADQIARRIEFYWNGGRLDQDQKVVEDASKPFLVKIHNVDYRLNFKIRGEVIDLEKHKTLADLPGMLVMMAKGNAQEGDRSKLTFDQRGIPYFFFYESDDLLQSTTPVHEFGHALGLAHADPYWIGKGRPRIMCPRGTIVEAPYQYDPSKPDGQGGTLYPRERHVTQEDIDELKLPQLLDQTDYLIHPGMIPSPSAA